MWHSKLKEIGVIFNLNYQEYKKGGIEVGAVVIGRNEGERLETCLKSIIQFTNNVVYVDSGSADNSVETAKNLNVEVVLLDLSSPFTAARARNEGFKKLSHSYPELSFVQFIDGDCEIVDGWLQKSVNFLLENPNIALTCGRLRERHPNKSIYNMLCDIEWNTPIGEIRACGGVALGNVEAFKQVGGFNPNVIAGEEPELCVRLREKGWCIWRLDAEMAWHDANMIQFSQWWTRSVRTGYAFALGSHLHGAPPERHWVNEVRRGKIWGLYFPLIIIIASMNHLIFLLGLIIYPAQMIRVAIKNKNKISNNWKYAFYITLGKFPEMQGQFKFYLNKLFKSRSKIIEYKS